MTIVEACARLGLPATFSPRDLKRAYRRAAAANHPDRGGDAECMVLVNEAYEVLSSQGPAHVFDAHHDTEQHTEEGPSWSSPNRWFYRFRSRRHQSLLEKCVVRLSAALALCAWIAGMVDSINVFPVLRSWMLLGLPFSYLTISVLLRLVAGFGIHIYNLGRRVRRIG